MGEKPQCGSCRFFSNGYCVRYAPRAIPNLYSSMGIWPLVMKDYWCGEFEPAKEPER